MNPIKLHILKKIQLRGDSMAVAHKSAISVGLLYIPVGLYKTTRDIGISFNQLCKDTHERIKYKKICPSCNKEVSSKDIIKGYEFEDGKYITFTEDELENIKSKKDKTIHIEHFAKMSDIDSIYFEKNYYVIPEAGAEKAYELLRQALLNKGEVAIAQTVFTTKEELLILYPTTECIVAKMLFYQEEIQEIPKSISKVEISNEEMGMANTMIDTMTKKFDITSYHDEYQEKLRNAITQKIQGQEIVSSDNSKPNNVINLMEALQKTVEQARKGTA